ncbi:MAG: cytochrome c3 family protein [Anaerolineales bacterium]|jgi:predicted CXXCH cytochrome family protein
MKTIVSRIIYGALFAIPLMLLTYAFAQASPSMQEEDQPAEIPTEQDCKSCHPAFYETWENGLHGQAFDDPAFQKAWVEQGSIVECLTCHVTGYDATDRTWESDGVSCQRCHNPIPENHPAEPMPVSHSSDLCAECHTETSFQWGVSVHAQNDLGCETCHDPHGSQLLAADSSELCASCHQARSSNFSHTAHSEEGLACTDCHMTDLSIEGVEEHGEKDHSFFVSLDTCNGCHVSQMHESTMVHEEPVEEELDPMVSAEVSSVLASPQPVSPIGFALLAGLVGLAAGVVLAPWIDRFQHRLDLRDKEK